MPDPDTEHQLRKEQEGLRLFDKVSKTSGYIFDGEIRAMFITTAGEIRYVVESEASPGLLHIFAPTQLKRRRLAAPIPDAVAWQDDPSADERWNAGLDYGQTQLCTVLGVDPASVRWDAATETLDGDVQSVIGNILTARFGDDWRSALVSPPVPEEQPVGYLFQLRYGPDNWSRQDMYSELLPSNPEDARNIRPLYARPPASADAEMLVALADRLETAHSQARKKERPAGSWYFSIPAQELAALDDAITAVVAALKALEPR